MKGTNPVLVPGLAVLLGVFTSGCAASLAACRPGDSSAACCIKKFPLSPMESCSATEVEVLETLNGMHMVYEAAKEAGEEAAQQAEDAVGEEEDDFSSNAHLPEWKQECIKGYVNCKKEGWTGNCYVCLRYCEGQQQWPFKKCHQRR